MTKRIRDVSKTYPVIRDTSVAYPPIDPAELAAALGAEQPGNKAESGGSPLTQIALAAELAKRAQQEAAQRQKVVVSDAQRQLLEDLASTLTSNGSHPTSAQVATAVLSIALRSLVNASEEQRAALAQELAALTNGNSGDAKPSEKDA